MRGQAIVIVLIWYMLVSDRNHSSLRYLYYNTCIGQFAIEFVMYYLLYVYGCLCVCVW
jgi:hypothetical protein